MIKKAAWGVFILSFAGNLMCFLQVLMSSFYLERIVNICYIISMICIIVLILTIVCNAFMERKFLSRIFTFIFIYSLILQFGLSFFLIISTSE